MSETRKPAVLVTGASRGIGRALCEELLRRGFEVHGLVRKPDGAPAGVVPHVGDIRDRELIRALMKELAPRLDWYIANAGISYSLNPRNADAADKAAETMEINGTATIFSIYALAYEWIHLNARDKRIGVVSSLASEMGLPKTSVYAGSKAAQLIACQGLEHDLGRNGISVTVALPGFIETDMSAEMKQRPFLISAPEAARHILDGMERGKFRVAFPRSTALLSWLSAHTPRFLMHPTIKMMDQKKLL